MKRPVDSVIEFLQAEQARGKTHILLDEDARSGLRELFLRSRATNAAPTPAATSTHSPTPTTSPTTPVATTPTTSGNSKTDKLASLRHQALSWEPARALKTLRDTMVFSSGNPDAKVIFVGEAPGYEEERKREPFAGSAGQKLNDILKAMGLSRDEVYITHIVKFRPATPRQTTNNRKPTAEEIAAFLPFVRQEIEIIRPICIVTLGDTATEGLLGSGKNHLAMRDAWHEFNGVPVRVSYHPSQLLQSNASQHIKRQVWEDMLAVMEKIALPISEKQRAFFLPKA